LRSAHCLGENVFLSTDTFLLSRQCPSNLDVRQLQSRHACLDRLTAFTVGVPGVWIDVRKKSHFAL